MTSIKRETEKLNEFKKAEADGRVRTEEKLRDARTERKDME